MIKKTALTQSFVASLAIAFALNIVSCSHEQSKAGWDGVREGAASDQSGSADTAAAEGDKSSTTDEATSAPADTAGNTVSSNDDKKSENSESLDSGAQANVAALMPEASAKAAPTDGGAAQNTNLDKKDDLTVPISTPEASKDAAAAVPTPDSSAASSTDKSSTDVASATPAPVDTAKTDTAQPEVVPSADSAQSEAAASNGAEPSASSQKPADKAVAAASPAKMMVSQLPKFPTEIVKAGDQVLNRYYFIRSGDNAGSVAAKIFGNSQASQDLVKWNGGKSEWKPGQIIKYTSPQAPADQKMVSFWEERNTSPTTYQVKAGDTLSKIAQTEYGDLRSWSEIAITNKMANPDRLAIGMTLNLFPSEMSAPVGQANRATASSQAKAETPANTQNTQAASKPEMNAKPVPANPQAAKAGIVLPPQAQVAPPAPQAKSSMDPVERDPIADAPSANVPAPGAVNDLPLPGQVTKTPPAPAKANGVKEASMEVAHFVGQNLFMVALGMGALGFLFFLMLLKKRRSEMDSEF